MAPPLMDELVEEILLRFPPDEPASLFGATLVCKDWRRLITSARFCRRFREHYRTAPLLGYFTYCRGFVAVTESPFSCLSGVWPPFKWYPIDTLHGRVLFHDMSNRDDDITAYRKTVHLVVWNWNSTDDELLRSLRVPLFADRCSAAPGCGHLDDCAGSGPFQVVAVVNRTSSETSTSVATCVYSSEHGSWSNPVIVQLHQYPGDRAVIGPAARAQNELYFICTIMEYKKHTNVILEYDLGNRKLSVLSLPSACKGHLYDCSLNVALVTLEDGTTLGLATVMEYKLYIWSRKKTDLEGGEAGWSQPTVVMELLPDLALLGTPEVLAIAKSVGVIFQSVSDWFFSVDLKSGRVRNLCEGLNIVPVMTFCIPGCTNIISRPKPFKKWNKLL